MVSDDGIANWYAVSRLFFEEAYSDDNFGLNPRYLTCTKSYLVIGDIPT